MNDESFETILTPALGEEYLKQNQDFENYLNQFTMNYPLEGSLLRVYVSKEPIVERQLAGDHPLNS